MKAEEKLKKLFNETLQFHVVHRDHLEEVGEWAESQDIGVFIYLTVDQWRALTRPNS